MATNLPTSPLPTDLTAAILELKTRMNAVILAHYYQDGEIQDLADFVGDSLDLSRKAAASEAEVIVFCGVRFMAEVAKILNPNRLVLLPDARAGCSLESSCPPEAFRQFRAAHPDHIAVTYINCSAEVKALSDVIVTSSNAVNIVNQLPKDQPILFAPDRHLGAWVARQTGRELTLWPGSCIVHIQFSERELVKLQTRHPTAEVLAHPECPDEILARADFIGSTSQLLARVKLSAAETFIVATESNMLHQMQKAAGHKTLIGAPGVDGSCSCNNCPYMALNTLEKLYQCMVDRAPEIQLPEALRLAAATPLQRMLEMS
jgi:quinolinate synthase